MTTSTRVNAREADAASRGSFAVDRIGPFVVKWGFVAVTVLLLVYFSATLPAFATTSNILQLLKSIAPMGIAGLGVMITLTVTGIDLSVGSVAGFAVSIAAWTMVIGNQQGWVAIIVVLFSGLVIGGLNAFLITVAKIPDLLATLATMFAIVGLKLVIVNGQSISSNMMMSNGQIAPGKFTSDFLWVDRGSVFGIPASVFLFVILSIALWFFLERTRWGRALYAIGANAEAARLAGVRVRLYRIYSYMACGLFASLAGLVLAARTGQGDVSAGDSLLLNAIAVALVSVSVLGIGRPNAWGTALGAVLIGVMINGFTMAGLPYYVQDLGEGIILLVALLFSFTFSRKVVTVVAGMVTPE